MLPPLERSIIVDGKFKQASFPGIVHSLDEGAERFLHVFDMRFRARDDCPERLAQYRCAQKTSRQAIFSFRRPAKDLATKQVVTSALSHSATPSITQSRPSCSKADAITWPGDRAFTLWLLRRAIIYLALTDASL